MNPEQIRNHHKREKTNREHQEQRKRVCDGPFSKALFEEPLKVSILHGHNEKQNSGDKENEDRFRKFQIIKSSNEAREQKQ